MLRAEQALQAQHADAAAAAQQSVRANRQVILDDEEDDVSIYTKRGLVQRAANASLSAAGLLLSSFWLPALPPDAEALQPPQGIPSGRKPTF